MTQGGARRAMNRAERRKIKKKCFDGFKHEWGMKDGYGEVCVKCGVVKDTI